MPTPKSSRFGRYRILAELGRGAMGVVYQARDPKINRLVAIKTIALTGLNPAEEREFRERFFHEAQAAGRLSHPRIVTIFDVGEEPDTLNPYIVMEYVDGRSLEEMLSKTDEKLAFDTTLRLTQELAEALDYAHAQGIVHRDIKPANIIVGTDSHLKIADFGVAKLNLAHRTLPGHTIGTPAYMSPEQLNGDPVDGRSDLFSLGVVLYRMLTGHRPFQGNSPLTVCFKVANHDPVPVTVFDSDLPPEVNYIVSRALAKNPAHRYQTGAGMALDLEDVRGGTAPRSNQDQTNSGEAAMPPAAQPVSQPAVPVVVGGTVWGGTGGFGDKSFWQFIGRKRTWQYVGVALLAIAIYTGLSALHPTIPAGHARRPSDAVPASAAGGVQIPTVSQTSNHGPSSTSNAVKTAAASGDQIPVASKASNHVSRSASNRAKVNVASGNQTPATRPGVPKQTVASSSLQIRIEHHFAAGNLSIWVDDKLAYTSSLQGKVKKRVVVFKGIEGYKTDSIKVDAGDHRIRVHVRAEDDSYDQSSTIAGGLPQDGERVLHIQCDKHKEMRLTLQ
jgi:serine/threonine protein kinase